MTGWNLPPGCTDADIDRAFGGDNFEGQELDLKSWRDKQQKLTDDEYDRRLAELDAWYQKTNDDLDAEFVAEWEKIERSEPDPDELRNARIDY